MIITSVFPYVWLGYEYGMKYAFIWMDRGLSGDPYKTKCTSLAQYKALYVGDQFYIHFQYSTSLTVFYTACFYGIQMPILFPICAFALVNQYFCDRIHTAFISRMPPSMGHELTE